MTLSLVLPFLELKTVTQLKGAFSWWKNTD